MSEFLQMVMLASLAAFGNIFGGVVAELTHVPHRRLGQALHAAAGIVIALTAVEIMPAALGVVGGDKVALAFLLGGCFYLALGLVVARAADGSGPAAKRERSWTVSFAACTDRMLDGVLIGSATATSISLGLTVALALALAALPQGVAEMNDLREPIGARRSRLLILASCAVLLLATAALSFFMLQLRSDRMRLLALVAASGPLLVRAVDDMSAKAHEQVARDRSAALAFVFGFALFTALSTFSREHFHVLARERATAAAQRSTVSTLPGAASP